VSGAWIFLVLAALPPLLLLMFVGYNAWALWVVYRGAVERRPRDVSAELRPPTGKAAAWVGELSALGFERLGELEVVLPSVGLLAPLRQRSTRHSGWIMVDAERTTLAEMAEQLLEFSTQLADGSFVETMHPLGHREVRPRLEVSHVPSTVAEAYRRHLEVLARRSAGHGSARRVDSMADQARHDVAYRREHARAVLRRPVGRQLLVLGAVAAVALILLASTVASFAPLLAPR
jgi:hypothetical protein